MFSYTHIPQTFQSWLSKIDIASFLKKGKPHCKNFKRSAAPHKSNETGLELS